jgi:nitrogen fixation/metabolism regulation signal transduction histidine kinase
VKAWQHSRPSWHLETTDLNALVAEHHPGQLFRAQHPAFAATLPPTSAPSCRPQEPQDIGRVPLNVYANAFYAPLARCPPARRLNWRCIHQPAGAAIQIWICDNGPAWTRPPAAKRSRPFFHHQTTREGTGLGLPLSYDVVVQGQHV